MSVFSKLRFLFFAAMLLPLQSCAFYYKAEPIVAWVVDAETKQPLEGVIVVAHWQLEGGLEGGDRVGQVMIMETVTDAKGRFYFPGWGPKPRSLKGSLKTHSPEVLLFKSGYKYRSLVNRHTYKTRTGDIKNPLRSDWDGKTIDMGRFVGESQEYSRYLSFLMGYLRFIEDDCNWKKTPSLILELQKQVDVFRGEGIVTDLYSVEYLPMSKSDVLKCGSVVDFFQGYQQ